MVTSLKLRNYKQVAGVHYGTPKEVWGFRTAPRREPPVRIAGEFLRANRELLGLAGLRLKRARVIESLGARHVIFQQWLDSLRVHRAYVTVHLSTAGRVYLSKSRAVPRELAEPGERFRITAERARRIALPGAAGKARVVDVERMWYPLGAKLRPAYRVKVHRTRPRRDWIVFVDGATGRVLRRYDNLAQARAVGSVFDPNPVIALGGSSQLVKRGRVVEKVPAAAYRMVTLRDLENPSRLDGRRVSTRLTRRRARAADGRFVYTSDRSHFEEVMAYYHLDAAIRYLELLGYRGSRAIFGEAVPVNANGTEEDNSWYSPHERSLTFGLGGVDDAEDAEVILHELGHAIQDAICPGFGQSLEAAAMGEGFGDYFAASFFADRKPARYRTSVGTWDFVTDTEHDPPCLRRVDERLTMEAFEHQEGWEHENGRIWSAALWDVGRAVGRAAADRIIVESHFQLDGFTTLARGARAILDADRNLYAGGHLAKLREVFRKRGIGPVE
jgi:Zn-dependent metalloprotease